MKQNEKLTKLPHAMRGGGSNRTFSSSERRKTLIFIITSKLKHDLSASWVHLSLRKLNATVIYIFLKA